MTTRTPDLTGARYQDLLVIERAPSHTRHARWRCQCACGRYHIALGQQLRNGQATRCTKCRLDARRRYPPEGTRWGSWRYLGPGPAGEDSHTRVWAECGCGFKAVLYLFSLSQGRSKSCADCAVKTRRRGLRGGNDYGISESDMEATIRAQEFLNSID